MLIVCPSCASEYSIDPDLVGTGGRRMRCAACRTTWRVEAGAAEDESFDEAVAAEAPEAEPDAIAAEARSGRASPPEPGGGGRRVRAGAVMGRASAAASRAGRPFAAFLVLAAVGSALMARERVVRAAPETASLFAAIGLPVNLRGLAFRDVASRLVAEESGRHLVVEGEIVGVARAETPTPPIAIAVRGEGAQALYIWTIEPPRAMVPYGETARFRAKLAAPPAEAREVMVRFSDGPAGPALALRAP